MRPNSILPVILCGGSGTRLWPLSRKSFPKQFLSLIRENDKTLLQQTISRIQELKDVQNPIFICNEEHRFIVAEQIREINIAPSSIILEPFGRNTAAAITIAAIKAVEKGEDPHLLVLSSDHHINNHKKFTEIINNGIKYSKQGKLVTFGIIPDSPATRYGYIRTESLTKKSSIEGLDINAFIEKPDRKKAELFYKDDRFLWNSGIFLFKASEIIEEIKKYSPKTFTYCEKSLSKKLFDLDFERIDRDHFKECPNISIDIAVMEKTNKGMVIPLDVGWSDIGSWDSVWELSEKDKQGNVLQGNVEIIKSRDCYLKSDKRLTAAIGLENIVIVDTNDVILVANKNNSQEVKNIVKKLNDEKKPEALENKKCFRPWGSYLSLVKDKKWQVKIINVKPGQSLSLQKHNHRAEHWVVVSGEAKVEINKKIFSLKENESTYIPLGSMHRLSNVTNENLKIIEIQSGNYLGEDDIVRFEDNYGRNN